MEELERAVIKDYTPLDVIESCERRYTKSVDEGKVTDEDKFIYAWHLIKSRYRKDIDKGIKFMGELCKDGVDQRDYFYFMALGYYKLEEFQEAENCVNRVLNMEPKNIQAIELKALIKRKLKQDGLITAGIVGGAALFGAVAIGAVALIGAVAAKKK